MFSTSALLLGALVFAVCCLIQNAMFTWSSRSRNSGDPSYHRYAAWCSNGIYFLTNALITLYIMKFTGIWYLAVQGLLYTIAASEGSVYMMKRLLRKEEGKRKVGNQFTSEEAAWLREFMAYQGQPRKTTVIHHSVNVTNAEQFRVGLRKLAERGEYIERRDIKPSEILTAMNGTDRPTESFEAPQGKDSIGQ